MSNKFKIFSAIFSAITVIALCLVVFNKITSSEITSSQYVDLRNDALIYGSSVCFILLERRFEDNKIALREYKEIKSCFSEFARDSLREAIHKINSGEDKCQ